MGPSSPIWLYASPIERRESFFSRAPAIHAASPSEIPLNLKKDLLKALAVRGGAGDKREGGLLVANAIEGQLPDPERSVAHQSGANAAYAVAGDPV